MMTAKQFFIKFCAFLIINIKHSAFPWVSGFHVLLFTYICEWWIFKARSQSNYRGVDKVIPANKMRIEDKNSNLVIQLSIYKKNHSIQGKLILECYRLDIPFDIVTTLSLLFSLLPAPFTATTVTV